MHPFASQHEGYATTINGAVSADVFAVFVQQALMPAPEDVVMIA